MLDDSGGKSRLTRHLRNTGKKNLPDVDVGSAGITLTDEASNDDIDLRKSDGGFSFGDNDDVRYDDRDDNIEQDNALLLVKWGKDKSLPPLGDIHRDGNNNDKIEREGGDKASWTVFETHNILKKGNKQLESGATASTSEEQVSGKEAEQEKSKIKK